VTFKVIHVLQVFSNEIFHTAVQQLTRFKLTERVARLLCDGWACCIFLHTRWLKDATSGRCKVLFCLGADVPGQVVLDHSTLVFDGTKIAFLVAVLIAIAIILTLICFQFADWFRLLELTFIASCLLPKKCGSYRTRLFRRTILSPSCGLLNAKIQNR